MKMIMLCKECLVEPTVNLKDLPNGIIDYVCVCPACLKELHIDDITWMAAAKYRKLDQARYLAAMKKPEVERG
ncbi:MAG: hypothetical protein WCO26_24115 [Deltaproteobacteria bacterium]